MTPVDKSDISANDKQKTWLTLKKLTGLPLESVNQIMKNLQLECNSNSEKVDMPLCVGGICHSNKNHLHKMQANINSGKYDTKWVKFTTQESVRDTGG